MSSEEAACSDPTGVSEVTSPAAAAADISLLPLPRSGWPPQLSGGGGDGRALHGTSCVYSLHLYACSWRARECSGDACQGRAQQGRASSEGRRLRCRLEAGKVVDTTPRQLLRSPHRQRLHRRPVRVVRHERVVLVAAPVEEHVGLFAGRGNVHEPHVSSRSSDDRGTTCWSKRAHQQRASCSGDGG